jgi:hypothetical protein
MLLVKLITPKKINELKRLSTTGGISRLLVSILLIISFTPAFSQDNSPYSRYGLGDIVPSTNINSRGMGGISAGYNDILSINFNNPASYGSFQALREARSKKLRSGRAILDIGVNIENHSLIVPNQSQLEKFTSSNLLFSHMQVGVPLRTNWGLTFGLRPVTRVTYDVIRRERLHDPNTGLPIDSAVTRNQGDGGAYLASVGLGHRIMFNDKQGLSLGFNAGYMFGQKNITSRRILINDTVSYAAGNYQTNTSYGNVYFNLGLQYHAQLDTNLVLTFGAFGNLKQKLKGSQDLIRETFLYDDAGGSVRIDSVYQQSNVKGDIEYPSNLTAGFTLQRTPTLNKSGWMIGVDYVQANWSEYRFYGQTDSVQNKWELRVGGELRPSGGAARRSYFGNVAYRIGFFYGTDYIKVQKELPAYGASFGLGLPLRNWSRQTPYQATMINISFEYNKRGNNENLLKENMFRISAGFSISDFWFIKKQYE